MTKRFLLPAVACLAVQVSRAQVPKEFLDRLPPEHRARFEEAMGMFSEKPVESMSAEAVSAWIDETEAKLTAACEATGKAMDDAVQKGALREPNATIWKAWLKDYAIPLNQFSFSYNGRNYPEVGTTPGLENVKAAWAQVRAVTEEARNQANEKRAAANQILSGAIQKIVASATKPEDVEPLRKPLPLFRRLPEGPMSSDAAKLESAIENTAQALKVALAAFQKNDFETVARAFGKMPDTFGLREFGTGGMPGSVWNPLRYRLSAAPRAEVIKAQRALEKAMIARRPVAECQLLLAEVERRISQAVDLMGHQMGLGNMEAMEWQQASEVVSYYQQMLTYLKWVESGTDWGPSVDDFRRAPSVVPYSSEYQAFITKLLAERKTLDEARLDEANEQRSLESRKRRSDAAKLAEEGERTQVRQDREWVLAQLAPVRTHEDLVWVIRVVPSKDPKLRTEIGKREEENWDAVETDLKRIAQWWIRAPENEPFPVEKLGSSPQFALALRKLRDLATRDVLAQNLNAPELRQPPLAEMAPMAAARRLGEEAGRKGDWKQARRIWEKLALFASEPSETLFIQDSLLGVSFYLAGKNLEEAGYYQEAAQSYRLVLKKVGEHLPVRAAGESLQALQKTYPEAFKTPATR